MSSKLKSRLFFALKFGVAGGLIGWLIKNGTLDFGKLKVLVEQPSLLALDLGVFALSVALTGMRWRCLLDLTGVKLPFWRVLQLQLTSLFFNVVIPGNVGGDVVKAVYASREAKPEQKTAVLLIVVLERALGLAGLIALAVIVVLARFDALWVREAQRPLLLAVLALGAGLVIGGGGFFLGVRYAGARMQAWADGPSRFAKLATQVIAAMRLLVAGPRSLALALGISMVGHASAIGLMTALAPALTNQVVPFSTVASLFPLGMLTVILPVSPSGMGVGHAAFNELFASAGIRGGADIFNVYMLGQIVPCLFGVFPYLALKRSGDLPTVTTNA